MTMKKPRAGWNHQEVLDITLVPLGGPATSPQPPLVPLGGPATFPQPPLHCQLSTMYMADNGLYEQVEHTDHILFNIDDNKNIFTDYTQGDNEVDLLGLEAEQKSSSACFE